MADTESAKVKKIDKKARRAAKVQQKQNVEDPGQSASARQTSDDAASVAKSSPSKSSGSNQPMQTPADNSKPNDDKKPLTKAERRAIQEAQRKAKEEKKNKAQVQDKPSAESTAPIAGQDEKNELSAAKKAQRFSKEKDRKETPEKKSPRSGFFSHLSMREKTITSPLTLLTDDVHPVITQIGLQYARGVICGSNARAMALLCALKKVIADYSVVEGREMSKDLLDSLNRSVEYLNKCRPASTSMLSVIKYIKPLIQSSRHTSDNRQAKEWLCQALDSFYEDRIFLSDEAIARKAASSLSDSDVIITYGHSSLIQKVLVEAYVNQQKTSISVVVVDSRPRFEGREMIRKLVTSCPGITCSYIQINALSYIMPRASKVLLGAHAVFANGYIMSRVGTSQVALVAKAYNKPVLVCCETYKFSDRMQTDSIVYNEIGDSDAVMRRTTESITSDSLKVYNLLYDVTPHDYITGLVTESGIIPCTSAPVVIRVKQQYDFVNA